MNKLTKTQEKRFDEKFENTFVDYGKSKFKDDYNVEDIKQHLAEELALQTEWFIKRLEKIKTTLK